MRAKLAPWWFLGLLWLLAAPHVWAATAATVTPGDWALYGGTSILSRHATEAACIDAAKARNVTRTYTCRTSTGIAVTVTVDPPPPAVTATLTASPQTVASGAASALTWSSSGAAS